MDGRFTIYDLRAADPAMQPGTSLLSAIANNPKDFLIHGVPGAVMAPFKLAGSLLGAAADDAGAAIYSLPELVREAIRTIKRPDADSNPQIKAMHELRVPFEHRGTVYRVRLMVTEFNPSAGLPTDLAKLHSLRVEDVILEPSTGDVPGKITLGQLVGDAPRQFP